MGEIDSLVAQEGAVGSYLDYLKASGDINRFCAGLKTHIQSQNEKLFPLLNELDQARQNNLQNQYSLVRKRFQSANAQLYFLLKRYDIECPSSPELNKPILYFFADVGPCAECTLQAGILDHLRETCKQPIQIFAFPIEGGIEPIDLLVKDYNITHAPSLVINDETYSGVQSPSQLNQLLSCQ